MISCYHDISPKTAAKNNLPPIIFLHGIFEAKASWTMVAPVIVENTGRKAYTLDARNHGESPTSPTMDFDVLVTDVLEFMNDLHIQKAVVVGHSMGGRTAIILALKHPERVDSLIVEDMTPRDVKSNSYDFVSALIDVGLGTLKYIPPEMDLDEAKRELFESLVIFAGNVSFIDVERVRKNYHPCIIPIKKVGKSFQAQADPNAIKSMLQSQALVQNLAGQNLCFNGNALFLYGSKAFFKLGKDTTIPQMFPRAVVRKVEGASHMIHLDSPEEYTKIVSDFILQLDAPKSKY